MCLQVVQIKGLHAAHPLDHLPVGPDTPIVLLGPDDELPEEMDSTRTEDAPSQVPLPSLNCFR